jgi:hypothetical protein
MKTLHVFRILSVLLMVFGSLAAATPANADSHVHDDYILDINSTWLADDPENPCGFDIQFREYGVVRLNVWFDEDGRVTHEVDIYGNVKEDLSANGKTVNIQVQGPVHFFIEYPPNEILLRAKQVGTAAIATVPHYGKIRGGGGQILETVIFTLDGEMISYSLDKWVGNFSGDWGPICAYLGPE